MPIHLLYIDPGSGSYLVQMIIAGILGALFYFKNMWRRIRTFFSGNKDIGHKDGYGMNQHDTSANQHDTSANGKDSSANIEVPQPTDNH